MRRHLTLLFAGLSASAVLLVAPTTTFADHGQNKHPTILEFNHMLAVNPAPQTLRGRLLSGGAPWKITTGVGELKANGKVEVAVTGLVLVGTGANPFFSTNTTRPPASRGFSVQVSCAAADSTVSGPFTTDAAGNSRFETTVALPTPCDQPIVLVGARVNQPDGTTPFRWFARSVAEVDR